MNKNIKYDGRYVHKKYLNNIDIEFYKAYALWDISVKNGFYFPRPISIDFKKNTITYEFIKTNGSIRQIYLKYMMEKKVPELYLNIIKNAGRILAKIHKNLNINNSVTWEPKNTFGNNNKFLNELSFLNVKCPWVFVHCDYGFNNIEYIMFKNQFKLIIFDPSPNYYSTFRPNLYAPVYLDIGHFVSCLDGLISLHNYPFIKWKRLEIIKNTFISGYQEEINIVLERKMIDCFAYAISKCYINKKFKNTLLRRISINIMYNKFKNNRLNPL